METEHRVSLSATVCLEIHTRKKAVTYDPISTLDEIIGAYADSRFTGDEDDSAFIGVVGSDERYGAYGNRTPAALRRQARESLKVLSQISYLHLEGPNVIISLASVDAHTIFQDLSAISGPRASDREAELRRLADFFRDGSNEDFFEYPNTVVNDIVQSGFIEGNKVTRTHVIIERNQDLRKAFFASHPVSVCDVCTLDTAATYPWTSRILDLHHLLPLCSGTRVESTGTTFNDLVPVCPSCHRAVHRFYDGWLREQGVADFQNERQARAVYHNVKASFGGLIHA